MAVFNPPPTTSAPDIAVYCFEHDLRAGDELLWTVLFNKGAELLDELILLSEIEVGSRISFIGEANHPNSKPQSSQCPICFG